jgi:hypothetical protein
MLIGVFYFISFLNIQEVKTPHSYSNYQIKNEKERNTFMSRGSRIQQRQQNQIRDGRGQGSGKDYKPFIQAHDNKVASEGWMTRHLGWKTQRIDHTLSKHERRYLYFLEWVDEIVDIREQYPLLPQGRTEEIAQQLGIKHAHVEDQSVVMTTDFVITLQNSNGLIDVVRTVKPASKLTKRTLELFEIERRFFKEQGIDWDIILDHRIPQTLISNTEWMYEGRYLDTRPGGHYEKPSGCFSSNMTSVFTQILLKNTFPNER